ncbi:MAG: hypothetical protein JNL82_11275 [Myxococcales bacterium]|nr:hypothetical protein [Myxococcales bacterium]
MRRPVLLLALVACAVRPAATTAAHAADGDGERTEPAVVDRRASDAGAATRQPDPAAPARPASAEVTAQPEPAPVEPVAAAAEPPPEPCRSIERGEPAPRHPELGKTLAELVDSGAAVICGHDRLWQLRRGTLCGDLASFHDELTVEVRAGKVHRVWQRRVHNAAFCGGFDR